MVGDTFLTTRVLWYCCVYLYVHLQFISWVISRTFNKNIRWNVFSKSVLSPCLSCSIITVNSNKPVMLWLLLRFQVEINTALYLKTSLMAQITIGSHGSCLFCVCSCRCARTPSKVSTEISGLKYSSLAGSVRQCGLIAAPPHSAVSQAVYMCCF